MSLVDGALARSQSSSWTNSRYFSTAYSAHEPTATVDVKNGDTLRSTDGGITVVRTGSGVVVVVLGGGVMPAAGGDVNVEGPRSSAYSAESNGTYASHSK